MSDELRPGWYWVQGAQGDEWVIGVFAPARVWYVQRAGIIFDYWARPPAIIGPRILSPDEATAHQLDGPERPEEIER